VLLSYLVTSRTRRELLLLLWHDRAEGSVSALARRGRVSFAAAYRELGAMRTAGLARSRREGAATVYRANADSPHAGILRRLLAADARERA
jgi:DNA-binding transcriptional ArsR family regulator